jgi:hypothetical protein
MFSENHHKVLQQIALGFSDIETLTDAVGFPGTLTRHLLEELSQYGFIQTAFAYTEGRQDIADVYLKNEGQAAAESPDYFIGKPMATDKGNNWYGDRVAGDKFTGDKVMGNKVQIGTVQGDAVAGNKIVNAQDLTQAVQDIKALLDQLAIDYPQDDDFTKAGRAVGGIKNNPNLKQRLINAARESSFTAVEKAIEAVVENPAVGIIVAGVKGFIDAEG